MDQPTVADLEHWGKKRKIRREVLLERMNGLIPCLLLEACLRPFTPRRAGGDSPTCCPPCCESNASSSFVFSATAAWVMRSP